MRKNQIKSIKITATQTRPKQPSFSKPSPHEHDSIVVLHTKISCRHMHLCLRRPIPISRRVVFRLSFRLHHQNSSPQSWAGSPTSFSYHFAHTSHRRLLLSEAYLWECFHGHGFRRALLSEGRLDWFSTIISSYYLGLFTYLDLDILLESLSIILLSLLKLLQV